MEKNNPGDWSKIQPQSIITISDAQGIQDSMRRGLGVRGIDYTVQSVECCRQLDGLSTHLLFTLADSEQSTYLLVKIVDQLVDLYLYFEPSSMPGGSRRALLDRGLFWLFQEPADPNHFEAADLRYTMTLTQTVPSSEGNGTMINLTYVLKEQGELQCRHSEIPVREGVSKDMLATVVEYRTDHATENPEFLILEVGEDGCASSFVRFFLGCSIRANEVDVLAV